MAAAGILGKADLTANTNTALRTITASLSAAFTVNFCNRTNKSIRVFLAIAPSISVANSEWILYNLDVPGNRSVEKTGLVANASDLVVVKAENSGITAVMYGYEE